MNTVGVRELKNRLTHYLRLTKTGEEIVVTERGKPIAMIQKIEKTQPESSLEARLAKAAAEGKLILPTRKPLKRIKAALVEGKPVSKIVLENRK